MKKIAVTLVATSLGLFGTGINLGTFTGVSPNGTFLNQMETRSGNSVPDNCASNLATASCNMSMTAAGNSPDTQIVDGVLFINLTALGVAAGATLNIQSFGAICFGPASCPGGELPVTLAGVFDDNPTLGAQTTPDRLAGALAFNPGAVNPVSAANNPNTYFPVPNGISTNNVPDFGLLTTQSLSVLVPALPVGQSTLWLAIGVIDSYFADNADPNGVFVNGQDTSLGVSIVEGLQGAAPEPGTYALLLTGLGGLLVMRRKMVRKG